MKKAIAILLAVMMVTSLTTPMTAFAADEPKLTLTLGTTSAAEDTQTKALERFAENVHEKTDGNITINVFPASQLGDAVAEMESMISGAQDMFMEAELGNLTTFGIEELGVEPFGIVSTPEALKNFTSSELCDSYRERFRETNGVVTVAYNFYRQPIVMATKTELTTLEDFKGVKLRTPPTEAWIAAYEAVGFNPTAVAYNEVYLSLSQNVIDGTIAPLDAMYTMKFYEQAPYILKLGAGITSVALWMNEAKWDQLSDNQKEIFIECGQEAGDWYTNTVNEITEEYVAEMESAGTVVAEPSDELLQECLELWAGAAEEYEAEGKIPAGAYEAAYEAAFPEQ